MRKIEIAKKSGGTRTIYVPSPDEMAHYRELLPRVAQAQAAQCDGAVVHGFASGRSAITNARAHAGRRYTLCADLSDFFDSIRPAMLAGRAPSDLIAACMVDGAPRQGLPTSPALANIAAAPMDRAIQRAAKKAGHADLVYTRYADDLTLSSDDPAAIEWARKTLPEIITRCGLKINAKKTRVMDQRYQRRIITGVALADDGAARATRRTRRQLRAARHRLRLLEPGRGDERAAGKQRAVVRGLEQWARMPLPRTPESRPVRPAAPAVDVRLVRRLCERWGLRVPDGPLAPKSEDRLAPDCLVTGDPAYLLGPSQWGTSWSSCMRHSGSGYQYHRGATLWLALRGTRVACLTSTRTRTDGVTRQQLRARTLVHELRDGRRCYDRIYGESSAAQEELRGHLERAGYAPASRCRGAHVVGHVPTTWVARQPYCDSTHIATARASSGPHAGRQVYTVEIA